MRKRMSMILASTALAALAIPAVASADVPRCEAPVATPATATFTVTQPYGQHGQWDAIWTHDYTVTVQPDGSFKGTGNVYGPGGSDAFPEDVTGTLNADGTVSLKATRTVNDDVIAYSFSNAATDGSITLGTSNPVVSWPLEFMVTKPLFTAATTTDLNHGQYVKSQGGGKDAARACAGMPLKSTQGK
jgi:hypothetical protein